MRSTSISVALALAFASAGMAAAQGEPAVPDSSSVTTGRAAGPDTLPTYRIAAGTIIRITRTDSRRPRVTGIVTAADPAGVTVLADGDLRAVRIARADIARFEVAGRASGTDRAARGARDGFIVGGLLSAAVIGAACVDHGCGDEGLGFAVIFVGVPITGASTLFGTIAGATGSGRRWIPAPIPSGIDESARPVVEPAPRALLPPRGLPRRPRPAPGVRIGPRGTPFGLLSEPEEDGLTPLLTIPLIRHPRSGSPPRVTAALARSAELPDTPTIIATDLSASSSNCSPGDSC